MGGELQGGPARADGQLSLQCGFNEAFTVLHSGGWKPEIQASAWLTSPAAALWGADSRLPLSSEHPDFLFL